TLFLSTFPFSPTLDTGFSNTTRSFFEHKSLYASMTLSSVEYLDLKKGLFASFLGFCISDWTFANALTISLISSDLFNIINLLKFDYDCFGTFFYSVLTDTCELYKILIIFFFINL